MRNLLLKIIFYPLFIAGAFWFEGYMQRVPPGPKEGIMYTVITSNKSIHKVIDQNGVTSEIKLSTTPPRMFVVQDNKVLSLTEME